MVALDIPLFVFPDHFFFFTGRLHVVIVLMEKRFEVSILFGAIRLQFILIEMLIALHILFILLFSFIWVFFVPYGLL